MASCVVGRSEVAIYSMILAARRGDLSTLEKPPERISPGAQAKI
jgi:hypothetical protein